MEAEREEFRKKRARSLCPFTRHAWASEQSVALFQHQARDRSAVATLIDHRTVTALWFEDFPMISVSIQRREIRWCKVWVARGVRRRGVASRSPRLRTLLGNEVPITGDASGEGRAIHDDCPSTVAASLLARHAEKCMESGPLP